MNKRYESSSPFEGRKVPESYKFAVARSDWQSGARPNHGLDQAVGERVIPHFRIMNRCGGERPRSGDEMPKINR
jgi:hypothetical protein